MASVLTIATKLYVEERVNREGLDVWLGGNDIEKEGVWKWADCSPAWEFNFWSQGNPDNYVGNQDCLHYTNNRWKWDDQNCAEDLAFVCRKYICPGRLG